MNNEQIKKLALENGFKLKEQPDGEMDLNPYVYDFAKALMGRGSSKTAPLITGKEILDLLKRQAAEMEDLESENERLKDQRENTVFVVNAFLDVIAYWFSVSLKHCVGGETRVALTEVIKAINEN